jgi:hypothetical protein
VQELARHGDVRLTMDRYTHTDQAALARAADRLPLPLPGAGGSDGRPDPERLREAVQVLYGVVLVLLGFSLPPVVAGRVAEGSETVGDGGGKQGTPGGTNSAA